MGVLDLISAVFFSYINDTGSRLQRALAITSRFLVSKSLIAMLKSSVTTRTESRSFAKSFHAGVELQTIYLLSLSLTIISC